MALYFAATRINAVFALKFTALAKSEKSQTLLAFDFLLILPSLTGITRSRFSGYDLSLKIGTPDNHFNDYYRKITKTINKIY